ncbi:MAG: glycogen synthase GlgA [Clostridia bacterium]|nr:glycogen synthase GlgA [Clostridia bacterium]
MKNLPMKVLIATSEAQPFIKTGGLADVAGTLPIALKKLGVDVRVILPKYRIMNEQYYGKLKKLCNFNIKLGWRSQYCGIEVYEHKGVTFYFVDNEYYFARGYVYGGGGNDEAERFGFFSKAVLEAMPHIDFFPDVLHCNDWQTGMTAALLKLQYKDKKEYSSIRTLFTIHNLRYQGVFERGFADELLSLGKSAFDEKQLEYFGNVNFLKAGLVYADAISTVSPTYAKEIQTSEHGETLENVLRARSNVLHGILNGIDHDEYDPRTDKAIAARYPLKTMRGKAVCRSALRQELNLTQEGSDAAIIAMVTRLTEQKGMDIVEYAIDELMKRNVQLAILGSGEARYCDVFARAVSKYPGRIALRFEYNESLAHRFYAGADMFLMPSAFEPCGLSQMLALRYGTIPIVRETGGLIDSIPPYNKITGEGLGFTFARYDSDDLVGAVDRALDVYFNNTKQWKTMIARALETDYGWESSARKYIELYNNI